MNVLIVDMLIYSAQHSPFTDASSNKMPLALSTGTVVAPSKKQPAHKVDLKKLSPSSKPKLEGHSMKLSAGKIQPRGGIKQPSSGNSCKAPQAALVSKLQPRGGIKPPVSKCGAKMQSPAPMTIARGGIKPAPAARGGLKIK